MRWQCQYFRLLAFGIYITKHIFPPIILSFCCSNREKPQRLPCGFDLRSKPRFVVLKCLMNTEFGRSGRIRTDGIEVPNFARYQLRHTPIGENIQFFCQIRKWSNLWSKVFCRRTRRRKSEETRGKRRFRELSEVGSRGGHTLPNFARYQLRHTPRFSYVGKYIPNNTLVNIVNDTYLGICRAPARQCAVPGPQVSQTNKQALILYYSSVRLSQFRKSCAPISESVGTMRSAPHLRQNTRTPSSVTSAS